MRSFLFIDLFLFVKLILVVQESEDKNEVKRTTKGEIHLLIYYNIALKESVSKPIFKNKIDNRIKLLKNYLSNI